MSETEAPLLQLNGVSVVYDGHAVIDDLSLEVGRGEFVVIHGRTGGGQRPTPTVSKVGPENAPSSGTSPVSSTRRRAKSSLRETALTSSTRPSADGSGAPWAS